MHGCFASLQMTTQTYVANLWDTILQRGHQRKLDEACLTSRVVDTLHSFPVIPGVGPEDVGHEGLRIPVIEREPAGLHLHHDAVSGQEDVVSGGQRKFIEKRLIGRDGLRSLEALAI